ncbi:MAG: hypothetical protein H0X39_13655 [Actinobacteria bacterium]|nr:hypothetical protein [Actinomycetota bacterium]
MNRLGLVDCSEAPATIQTAERWRVAGEKLHAQSPEKFEAVFEFLVLSLVGTDEDRVVRITESYFLT